MITQRLFENVIAKAQQGQLTIKDHQGSERSFGQPSTHTPVSIKVNDPRFYSQVVLYGDIGFGEAYVDQLWECDNLQNGLDWFARNARYIATFAQSKFSGLLNVLGWLHHFRHQKLLQLDFKKSGNDYLFTRAANADLQVELASLLSLVLVLSENDYAQWIDLLSTHMDLTYQLKGTDVMTLVKMLKNLRNKQQELWQWHQTQSLWENEDLFAGMRHVFGPQTVTEGQLTVLKSA